MTSQTSEKVKQVKRTFRLYMNGVASRSMRDKGMGYKINWGIPLGELRRIAMGYGRDYDLSIALWSDDVRECRILATMIMPPEMMSVSLAGQWLAESKSPEMVEMLALNLFQNLAFADVLVYKWLDSVDTMSQMCAFHVLSRLLCKGHRPDDTRLSLIFSAMMDAMEKGSVGMRHAAANCLVRLVSVDEKYASIASKALKPLNLDIFQ